MAIAHENGSLFLPKKRVFYGFYTHFEGFLNVQETPCPVGLDGQERVYDLHRHMPAQDLANTQRNGLAHETGVCQRTLHPGQRTLGTMNSMQVIKKL